MLDLQHEVQANWAEYNAVFQKVLSSGQFILGPEVTALESEIASLVGVKHAIGMNSGTDALVIGLRALGVAPGDEVITSPFSFFATAEAISQIGAKPIFVDVDPKTFNLDPDLVSKAMTPKTRCIVPVHLFGQPAELTALTEIAQKSGVPLLEDAAQAIGASFQNKPVGQWGNAAAFSFFPTKNLGAFGDGGMLVTDDAKTAEMARMLRVHGSKVRYHHDHLGYTSRLDELQAAFLRIKLRTLQTKNQARREAARRYNEGLRGLEGLQTPYEAPHREHVFHQYTILVQNGKRDQLQSYLNEKGISTIIYYPIPIHRTNYYAMPQGLCPVTEKLAGQVISLPIWPEISTEIQLRITSAIHDFWQNHL